VIARFAALIALGLALLVPWSEPRVEAQLVITEREQTTLASVQVGDYRVSMMIAYEGGSALLMAAVSGSDGNPRYIPLMVSTYRGMPSFQLDVLSPDANGEIRIRMSKPRSEVLAHYRFGSATALTRFGPLKLLGTPFPKYLNGGPVPFPKEGSNALRLRASFFHYDDM